MSDHADSAVVIREMMLEDLAPVYTLGEQLFTAEQLPSLHRTWDEYEPVGLFQSDGDFCFVAELRKEVVGFALGKIIDKRRSAWCYGYLMWLGIEPSLNRSGIASRLLDAMTEAFILAGARMMIADTEADNRSALEFFREHGFGKEQRHVYLSRNLTGLPAYQRFRGQE